MHERAFPLLKQLTDVGDPLAKRVFKEEIVKRIESNYEPVINFLFENRMNIDPTKWERFTFSGNLALIITHAQEARISKNTGLTPENIKGVMVPGKIH